MASNAESLVKPTSGRLPAATAKKNGKANGHTNGHTNGATVGANGGVTGVEADDLH